MIFLLLFLVPVFAQLAYGSLAKIVSTPVTLPFNNIGTSSEPGGANYYNNNSYVASFLPGPGFYSVNGVEASPSVYGLFAELTIISFCSPSMAQDCLTITLQPGEKFYFLMVPTIAFMC